MRKRKHRLCTTLLCSVLILSNVLSAGTPVYAKSPDMGNIIVSTAVSDEAMPSASEDDYGSVRSDSPETDLKTGNEPESSSDDTAVSDTPGTNENSQMPTEPGSDESGNNEDPSDQDDSDKTENPDTPGGTTATEDSDNSENRSETDDAFNSEEDGSISGNDTDDEELLEETTLYDSQSADTSEYLTEDPEGYNLSDIEMKPGSYAADFSAVSKKDIYDHFQLIYTDNTALAEDFFKGTARITEETLKATDFTLASFDHLNCQGRYDSDSYSYLYDVSATFTGEDGLMPNTTYYYRLVYYGNDNTEQTYCYSFLTVPLQFTTKKAPETSSVKITDISAEESGYWQIEVVWTIENPENESLFDITLHCTNGTENDTDGISAIEYRDDENKIVPNKYYAMVSNLESYQQIQDATAQLTTYTGNKVATTITSATIPLRLQSSENARIELTEKTGSGSFQALLKLSPYYFVDRYVSFKLAYRKKNDGSGNSTWQFREGYVSGNQSDDSASGTIELDNLSANTEYEYYIEPLSGTLKEGDFSEILGSQTNPLTFTTKEIKTYTKEDFPDEIFFNYIKSRTNTTGDEITSDNLEKLKEIDYPRDNASGDISSLQGIEHIENLTSISLDGHTITNVGRLSSLTQLTSINLSYNDLTQLPDLSGMTQLRYAYFDGNMISADSITADKVPASLLANNPNWIADTIQKQRPAEITVTFAPEYYMAGDTRPFFVKIEGLKKDNRKEYTLSLTVDGKEVPAESTSSDYYDMYYIRDILKDASGADTGISITEGTPCTVAIKLTDNYDHTWVDGKTAKVVFTGKSTPVANTRYIKPNAAYASVCIDNLPATYTGEDFASVSLIDQTGTPVGNASPNELDLYTNSYNPYKDVFENIYIPNITSTQRQTLSANIYLAKYLTPGDYRAVIMLADQTSTTFEKAVHVEDIAVIESLYFTTDTNEFYDNYGEYLYLYLDGTNVDPAKIHPVLYENGQAVTEFVNGSIGRYGDTLVYKLRKLETEPASHWNFSDGKAFTFDFSAAQGYEYISTLKDSDKEIYIYLKAKDFVTFEHYNYKKGIYEVKTDSTVESGTIVSVSVYTSGKYTEESLMGTAEGTVTDSLLSLTFTDAQGETYAPPKDMAAYFRYSYTDKEGQEQTFKHTNSSVEWYNYYSSGTSSKSPYTNMVLCHKAILKELAMDVSVPSERTSNSSVVTAQITDSKGTSIGNSKTLSKGNGSTGYTKYTGTWQSDTGLGEGIYSIRFLLDGKNVFTSQLCVYDDTKFYMNNQWMNTWSNSSTKGIYVSFSSAQLQGNYIHDHNSKVSADKALDYWNTGNYKLELFDRLGKSVTGWKVDHASWNVSDFYLYLKDVPEGYTGFYAKVTRDDNPGIRLDDNSIYYVTAYDANEKNGKWEALNSSYVWFNDLQEINAYYCVESYTYPVTVTITRPYDTTLIDTFTISGATSDNVYYFTTPDLKKTDPREVYRITAVNADGSSCSGIGYLGVRGSSGSVVNPTTVTLNKTTLNLQLGQSEKLTATVKPDNATNKNVTWDSDDMNVATVDAQGNVTAKSVGTTKITVTTADNNKKASCTVNVFNYTLDQTKLSFDLATENGRNPKQLNVQNGDTVITSNITWSSSDDSVATVTKEGSVTPVDAGKARILAAIKNGPTLTCEVTVSNNKLTAVSLSESSCELYLDTQGNAIPQKPNTKSLKLYYSPNTAEIEAVWTSTDETVVSVAPDPDNQTKAVITAHSKGTATINVTIATESSTETCACTVTVKTVTSAADAENALPQGLTALTNEQITLGEVSLNDFPGWEWMEEEKSVALTQFAGMQSKSFAARYTDPDNPDAEPYETAVPVTFSTVTGIGIQAESSTIKTDTDSEIAINWIMNGPQPDMSEYVKEVEWSSDKPAIANIQKDADGKAVLTAMTAGKATIKAQITFKNNKTCKAQYKITIVNSTPADIQISEVSRFTPDAAVPGIYRGKLGSDTADNSRTILATVTGATKLTAKSNNAKVAAVGKITTEDSKYTIPLTIKAAGMAKITLTANDAAKTQKDIFLYVTDSKPVVSEDPVTVNLQQTDGTAFMLYSGDGYQVTDAALSGENADKFSLSPDSEVVDGYILKAKEGTGKGIYKLTLNVNVKSMTDADAAEEIFYNVALTVKVIDQKPKYKVKQSAKFNLFYKDWETRLEITTDEVLNNAELEGCDFTLAKKEEAYYLTARNAEGVSSDCDKAGILTLTFDGYKPVDTPFTVNTEYKKPKITLAGKSATMYPASGIISAVISLKEGKEEYLPTVVPTLDDETINANLFDLTKTGNRLLLTARSPETLPASAKTTISLQETNWAEAVKLTYTVKTSKNKPAVKLGKSTLQLNANPKAAAYDMAATEIMWKDGAAFDPSHVSFSAADDNSKKLINKVITFSYDETTNQIIAKLNKADSENMIAEGSYKFKVNAIKETSDTTLTVSAPLTVKIVNVEMTKAITISSKGSIDVLNRKGSFVTVTPALKSLNGSVTSARLSDSVAHLFEIDEAPIKDNKIIIRAKSDAALITKYAYKVKLNLTIENAEGDQFYYQTPAVSLKLKQGKPKVTIAPKNTTFFSGSYNNAVTRKLTVTLKGAEAPAVERIELLNNNDAFECGSYNTQNGTFSLSSTENAVKGKSYKLQLKVTFKDQADNEKATIITYSVKVK